MQKIAISGFLVILLVICSCSPKYTRYIHQYEQSVDTLAEPDYARLASWAAHPWKKDLSDSLPAGFRKNYAVDSTIDVFFIHPTTLTSDQSPEWNADIHNAAINAKTDYGSILYQASVFNEYRVFAPRYRQAHLRSYFTTDTINARQAFDKAYGDVSEAFQYFLEHFNQGRPMIIASHSQGTTHAIRLINEYFTNKPLKNRLVVAYLTGMYISANYIAGIPWCRDSIQTGCLCGWRTYQKDYEPAFVHEEKGSCLVTNPLSWTDTSVYAPASLNSISVLRNLDRPYRHVTDARISNGMLWISKPKFPGSFLLKMKNYHIADINLFYGNIRQNAHTRVSAFWKR